MSDQKLRNLIADSRVRAAHIDRSLRVRVEELAAFVAYLAGREPGRDTLIARWLEQQRQRPSGGGSGGRRRAW